MGFGIMGIMLLFFGWITSIGTGANQETGNSDKALLGLIISIISIVFGSILVCHAW